jgi:hypothetical protein
MEIRRNQEELRLHLAESRWLTLAKGELRNTQPQLKLLTVLITHVAPLCNSRSYLEKV